MATELNFKELDHSSAELSMTVPQDVTAEAYRKIVNNYAKTLQIKGFRKGKVPVSVIEKKFGEALREEAMYKLIEQTVEEVLETIDPEQKPLYISTPKIVNEDQLSFSPDEQFNFTISYDLHPKFDLPDYTGYQFEFSTTSVSDDDIDSELEQLREQNSIVQEKEIPVENGVIVTADYWELDEEGLVVEGTRREDFVFTVGNGYSPFKIEEDVIGMQAGETKEIQKTMPDDYIPEEYAGKALRLGISVKTVKVRELPELDDEFAQDVSEKYETLNDLKLATRSRLEEQLEQSVTRDKIELVFERLLETTKIDLPVSMVEAELENSWHSYLSRSRMNESQILTLLKMQGKSKEDMLEDWRPSVQKSLKVQLLAAKIIDKEQIEASDEEMAERSSALESVQDPDQRSYYEMMFNDSIKQEKLNRLLIEKNTFTSGPSVTFSDFVSGKYKNSGAQEES